MTVAVPSANYLTTFDTFGNGPGFGKARRLQMHPLPGDLFKVDAEGCFGENGRAEAGRFGTFGRDGAHAQHVGLNL